MKPLSLSSEARSPEPPPQTRRDRYRRAAAFIESWLADESGYDEEVWPLLEEELKDARMRCRV